MSTPVSMTAVGRNTRNSKKREANITGVLPIPQEQDAPDETSAGPKKKPSQKGKRSKRSATSREPPSTRKTRSRSRSITPVMVENAVKNYRQKSQKKQAREILNNSQPPLILNSGSQSLPPSDLPQLSELSELPSFQTPYYSHLRRQSPSSRTQDRALEISAVRSTILGDQSYQGEATSFNRRKSSNKRTFDEYAAAHSDLIYAQPKKCRNNSSEPLQTTFTSLKEGAVAVEIADTPSQPSGPSKKGQGNEDQYSQTDDMAHTSQIERLNLSNWNSQGERSIQSSPTISAPGSPLVATQDETSQSSLATVTGAIQGLDISQANVAISKSIAVLRSAEPFETEPLDEYLSKTPTPTSGLFLPPTIAASTDSRQPTLPFLSPTLRQAPDIEIVASSSQSSQSRISHDINSSIEPPTSSFSSNLVLLTQTAVDYPGHSRSSVTGPQLVDVEEHQDNQQHPEPIIDTMHQDNDFGRYNLEESNTVHINHSPTAISATVNIEIQPLRTWPEIVNTELAARQTAQISGALEEFEQKIDDQLLQFQRQNLNPTFQESPQDKIARMESNTGFYGIIPRKLSGFKNPQTQQRAHASKDYATNAVYIHCLGLRAYTYYRTLHWEISKQPTTDATDKNFILALPLKSSHNYQAAQAFFQSFQRAAILGFYDSGLMGPYYDNCAAASSTATSEDKDHYKQERSNARRIAKWLSLCFVAESAGTEKLLGHLITGGADLCSSDESEGEQLPQFKSRRRSWRSSSFNQFLTLLRKENLYFNAATGFTGQKTLEIYERAPPNDIPINWIDSIWLKRHPSVTFNRLEHVKHRR